MNKLAQAARWLGISAAIIATMGMAIGGHGKGGSAGEIPSGVFRATSSLHLDLHWPKQVRYGNYSTGNLTPSEVMTLATAAKGNRWDMKNWKPGKVTLVQALGLNWNITWPQFNASLQQQAEQQMNAAGGGGGGGGTPTGNITTGGAKGMKGLYNALVSAGASSAMAIGLIANAMNESSLDPEARAMDTNGFYSNGLWQFNEATYPDSGSLVTGNRAQDMIRQIQYLIRVGGFRDAAGTDPVQVAGNFAASFEGCQGCQSGGAQWNSRRANVATVRATLGLLCPDTQSPAVRAVKAARYYACRVRESASRE